MPAPVHMHPSRARGFTFVEVIVGAAIATVVLACLWYFVVAAHGSSLATSARARYALELTEFLELLADDLYHARYVVYEGEDSRAGITLVLRRLDSSGQPGRELVRYTLQPEDQTITRDTGQGPRKLKLTSEDGSEQTVKLGLEREQNRLQLTLGSQRLALQLQPGTLAPAGSTQADAEAYNPPQWQVLSEAGATGEPGATAPEEVEAPDAGSYGFNPDDSKDLPTPQQGRGVAMAPLDRVAELPYQFVGGGDEQPASPPPDAPIPTGWYRANSNLTADDDGQPVVFLRRGNPLNQELPGDPGVPDGAAEFEWLTAVPNPVVAPPASAGRRRIGYDLSRSRQRPVQQYAQVPPPEEAAPEAGGAPPVRPFEVAETGRRSGDLVETGGGETESPDYTIVDLGDPGTRPIIFSRRPRTVVLATEETEPPEDGGSTDATPATSRITDPFGFFGRGRTPGTTGTGSTTGTASTSGTGSTSSTGSTSGTGSTSSTPPTTLQQTIEAIRRRLLPGSPSSPSTVP